MIQATAAVSICAFLAALWLARVVPASAGAVAVAHRALEAMRDAELDDTAREKAVRRASLQLFGTFVSILLRGGFAIGVSLVPIWLGNVSGLAPGDQVIAFLSRWDVIAIASIVITIGYLIRMRLWVRN
jgi:hypothetical protein